MPSKKPETSTADPHRWESWGPGWRCSACLTKRRLAISAGTGMEYQTAGQKEWHLLWTPPACGNQ